MAPASAGWAALRVGRSVFADVSILSSEAFTVVVFPAFHFTILEVKVKHQTVFPECLSSGKFQDWFLNPNPNPAFSQVCRDKLLTLVVDPNSSKPMSERFSNQPGVDVKVKHYGDTESAPFYEPVRSKNSTSLFP